MLFEKIKLENDEKILLIVRRHWFVLLSRVLSVLFSTFAPFVVIIFIVSKLPDNSFVFYDYSSQFLFLGALWILLNWLTLAYIWTDYYLDLWIVTDRRLIAIDQKSLFFRSIGSFRLERLQDMNVEIPGFLATMFNYGNIEAQTASGSEEEFQVRGLPDPRKIKSIILEAADNRMGSGNYKDI